MLAKHCISDLEDQWGKRQDGTEASYWSEKEPQCASYSCDTCCAEKAEMSQGTQLSWEEVGRKEPPRPPKKDAFNRGS